MRLLGAAEAELERLGAPLGDEKELYEEVLTQCRSRLNPDAVGRALAYGRTLTLEDAVDLASDGRGPAKLRS